MPTVYVDGIIEVEKKSAARFREQLAAVGDVEELRVEINCDGGDITEGMSMYNALRAHPARKVGVVTGIAASMASVILMGCDERRVAKGAFVMIHLATGAARGTPDQIQAGAVAVKKMQGELLDIYEARTKLSREQLEAAMSVDNYLTAEEAVAQGFADAIETYEARVPLEAVARLERAGSSVRAVLRERARRPVAKLSANDARTALEGALREAYPPDPNGCYNVWLCDLYEGQVIFEREGLLWAQPYTFQNGLAALTGKPIQVARAYVPFAEAVARRVDRYVNQVRSAKGQKR